MSTQLINRNTGAFTLDKGFTVSRATTLREIKAHFGKDHLKKNGYVVEIDGLYFLFRFHFENSRLKRIDFEIEESPKERNPWGNNRDFETNWIAQQMGDESGFVWDMNQAGRHYHLAYPWGSVGVYYDFKNGTFESSLNYDAEQVMLTGSTITEQNSSPGKPSLPDQEEVVFVKPSKDISFRKIDLTENKSAWLTIGWLSETLFHYVQNHYQELFDLHPEKRGKVVLYNEEIQSFRWHRSYLETPLRNPDHIKTSYMYSGSDFYDDLSLPHQFQPFLDFLNDGQGNDKYNQVTANWYANGNDYIAAHSDCRVGMKPEAEIAIITLCAKEDARELQFISKNLNETKNNAVYKKLRIETANGCIIKMHGDTQMKFRHKVPKAPQISGSRISLTFRKITMRST